MDKNNPAPGDSLRFTVDPNKSGVSASLRITGTFWGRLVDVYDQAADGTRTLQHAGYVVGSDVFSDGFDFLLETNPITAEQSLTILHRYGGDDGIHEGVALDASEAAYDSAFARLDKNLQPIDDVAIGGSSVFSMVPRNAAIVLRFDDLLDPDLISAETVRIATGSPPEQAFEGRIMFDQNYGDFGRRSGDFEPTFYSTRVIIDTTVTEVESFETDPPLPVNGVGLPAAINSFMGNTQIRIPTLEVPGIGQEQILRNLSGHAVSVSSNGTVDFDISTIDVTRAMRSGGDELVTGDAFNGFMIDLDPPKIIGSQLILITGPPVDDPDSNSPLDFVLTRFEFQRVFCQQDVVPGDVIRQAEFFALVTGVSGGTIGGIAQNVNVTLVSGDPAVWATVALGAAEFRSAYDPIVDSGREACFLRFSPDGGGLTPNDNLHPSVTVGVRFSEPMDPASMTAFDSMLLLRQIVPDSAADYVVGTVDQGLDLKDFTFRPYLDLSHVAEISEEYFFLLEEGDLGPSDLAGNEPSNAMPIVRLTLNRDIATSQNGGRVTRFTSVDEEAPIGTEVGDGDVDLPEWSGQHVYDSARQAIAPRPVVRFSVTADRSGELINGMTMPPGGNLDILTRMGSKHHAVWRYADLEVGLTDPTSINVDVEGVNWAPLGGQPQADYFEEFEIAMATSKFLPDEAIDPMTGGLAFPDSGLTEIFAANLLDGIGDPLMVMHPKELGYTISTGDLFATAEETLMMPFPMNRTVPSSEYRYYTWRDSGMRKRAAPFGGGVEIAANLPILGIDPMMYFPIMGTGDVSTLGLPLLMEFKCYPNDQSLGANFFDYSFGFPTGNRPVFRAFSAGGVDSTLQEILVNPDIEHEANGGFNPLTHVATDGLDTTVFLGSLDLVVRVSRSYSVWFDTELTTAQYQTPVMEPEAGEQPAGTSVEIAFRGATIHPDTGPYVPGVDNTLADASLLDLYGDYYTDPTNNLASGSANPGVVFLSDESDWNSDPSTIDGAQYYQVRITFTSNPETGIGPVLSALGMTWMQ